LVWNACAFSCDGAGACAFSWFLRAPPHGCSLGCCIVCLALACLGSSLFVVARHWVCLVFFFVLVHNAPHPAYGFLPLVWLARGLSAHLSLTH
jgi:hypothetical protein